MLSDCELAKNEQDKHVGLPSSQVVRVWWDFLQQKRLWDHVACNSKLAVLDSRHSYYERDWDS